MKIDSAPLSGTSPRPESQATPSPSPLPSQAPHGATPGPAESEGAPSAEPIQSAPASPRYRSLSRRARLWWALGLGTLALAFLLLVRDLVTPFIWAGVIAYILNPFVGLLQRRLSLHRGLSVAIIMLVLVGLASWGISAAIPIIRGDVTALTNSLDNISTYLATYLPNAGTINVAGIAVQPEQLIRGMQTAIADLPHMVVRSTWAVATNVVGAVLHILTFLISTFYLLVDGPRLRLWLSGRLPAHYHDEVLTLARGINTVFREYLRAEVILIVIMSTASLIALTVLGVRFALVLAPIVGFLEIFPIVGPFFAIALVALIALITPPNFGLSHAGYAIAVALVFFIMRQLEDYLVIPNVVGHAVKLHPVIILFALLCGASFGGILGMFLAVPITGAIKVLGSYTYDRLIA